ncbi:MAG TPA: hypothetical protein ENN03_06010 [bacterium]|nr:hypothetical protein [bacterium]
MFFTSGLFWFIEGILACVVIVGLKVWAEDRSVSMPWWKIGLIVLWWAWAGFTAAFIGTSIGEGEPHAALMGGIVFTVPAIVAAVLLWRFLGPGKSGKRPEPRS